VPDGEDELLATGRHLARDEPVEFVVGPIAPKKPPGEHDDTESAVGEALVDAAPKTRPDPQFEFVVPDVKPSASKALARSRTIASLSSLACEMNTSYSFAAGASGGA
jgi:hypothetical protein